MLEPVDPRVEGADAKVAATIDARIQAEARQGLEEHIGKAIERLYPELEIKEDSIRENLVSEKGTSWDPRKDPLSASGDKLPEEIKATVNGYSITACRCITGDEVEVFIAYEASVTNPGGQYRDIKDEKIAESIYRLLLAKQYDADLAEHTRKQEVEAHYKRLEARNSAIINDMPEPKSFTLLSHSPGSLQVTADYHSHGERFTATITRSEVPMNFFGFTHVHYDGWIVPATEGRPIRLDHNFISSKFESVLREISRENSYD